MRLDPGQAKSGMQETQNKETTASKDKDEKPSNAKSEDAPTLVKIPKTSPHSTTNTPKLKEDEVENSKLKVPKFKEDKVKNSTTSEFQEEHLSLDESPVTVYYVSKLSFV